MTYGIWYIIWVCERDEMHFCGGGIHFDGVASRLTCLLHEMLLVQPRCCRLVAGRLYRTVLCQCLDDCCRGREVSGGGDAAADNDPRRLNSAEPIHRDDTPAVIDDDDDDEDEDPASLPRLRFEISFHRPCGSLRRRQRRQHVVGHEAAQLDRGRRGTGTGPGQTIELEVTQCATSTADGGGGLRCDEQPPQIVQTSLRP